MRKLFTSVGSQFSAFIFRGQLLSCGDVRCDRGIFSARSTLQNKKKVTSRPACSQLTQDFQTETHTKKADSHENERREHNVNKNIIQQPSRAIFVRCENAFSVRERDRKEKQKSPRERERKVVGDSEGQEQQNLSVRHSVRYEWTTERICMLGAVKNYYHCLVCKQKPNWYHPKLGRGWWKCGSKNKADCFAKTTLTVKGRRT